MKGLVLAPLHNEGGKHDADEFYKEAKRFAEIHQLHGVVRFDNKRNMARRHEQLMEALGNAPDGLQVLGMFCHGWPKGMQVGLRRDNLDAFAALLADKADYRLNLFLAACSTAQDDDPGTPEFVPGPAGENGFADKLRDALVAEGVHDGWLDAHITKGHTTANPYVRRFYFDPTDLIGGEWVIRKGSSLWKRWGERLREDSEFRLSYTLKERDDIVLSFKSSEAPI